MHDHSSHHHGQVVELPRETEGLPEARKSELVDLQDGEEFKLEIVPVKKRIGDATVRMLAYNGSVPGPTLKVPQDGTITVHVTNHGDLDEEVLLAPSERVVVDVLFGEPGDLALEHRTPERTYQLASITVADEPPEQAFADEFAYQRTHDDMVALREHIEPFLKAPPDKTLSFVAEMDMGVPEGVDVVYVCPMHPEVVSGESGNCPKCGMKLLAQAAEEATYVCPMHPEVTSDK